MQIDQLNVKNRFKRLDPTTKAQLLAIEEHSLEHGRIFSPIYVWEGQREVVVGHGLVEIAKRHPELKHTIIPVAFVDWRDAEVWAIELMIAQPTLSLWNKLELAISCEDYWLTKGQAEKAKGRRNDLRPDGEHKRESEAVNKIVAKKVGCSATMVYYFKSVYFSGRQNLKDKCKEGEMSITTAYANLKPKKGSGSKKSDSEKLWRVEMVTAECNIFDECAESLHGKKRRHIQFAPVDPIEIRNKFREAKVPDGKIWLALYRDKGAMHVISRRTDKERGTIYIKVNAYRCHIVDGKNGVAIYEAEHITGSTDVSLHKDESEFETAVG